MSELTLLKPKYRLFEHYCPCPIPGLDAHGYNRLATFYGEIIAIFTEATKLPSVLVGLIFSFFCKDFGPHLIRRVPKYTLMFSSNGTLIHRYMNGHKIIESNINNVGFLPVRPRKINPNGKYWNRFLKQYRHANIKLKQSLLKKKEMPDFKLLIRKLNEMTCDNDIEYLKQLLLDITSMMFNLSQVFINNNKVLVQVEKTECKLDELIKHTKSTHYEMCMAYIVNQLNETARTLKKEKEIIRSVYHRLNQDKKVVDDIINIVKKKNRQQLQKEKRKANKEAKAIKKWSNREEILNIVNFPPLSH